MNTPTTLKGDKQIAKIAINNLQGQAQYDFLIDYFEEIRRTERKKALEAIENEFGWTDLKCPKKWKKIKKSIGGEE